MRHDLSESEQRRNGASERVGDGPKQFHFFDAQSAIRGRGVKAKMEPLPPWTRKPEGTLNDRYLDLTGDPQGSRGGALEIDRRPPSLGLQCLKLSKICVLREWSQ